MTQENRPTEAEVAAHVQSMQERAHVLSLHIKQGTRVEPNFAEEFTAMIDVRMRLELDLLEEALNTIMWMQGENSIPTDPEEDALLGGTLTFVANLTGSLC